MIINVIGECDKRPVLYTLMKICQTLGDVLVITNSTRLSRLSDTHDVYGHYQNTMIAVTQEGLDDFLESFDYDLDDFEYIIIDNIIAAEAHLVIYVEGLLQSEQEVDMLEYIEKYETIKLYKGSLISGNTLYALEEFEALRDMCPINPKIAEVVAKILGPMLNKDPKAITEIALQKNPADAKAAPKVNIKLPLFGRK